MKAEGRTELQGVGGGEKEREKKNGQCVCMGSGILSHHAALRSLLMTVLRGGKGTAACLFSPTAGGGFVRACGEQTSRSQEHGLVCGKTRDTDLKH